MGFGVAAGVRNGLREETLLDIVLNVDQKKDKKYKGETIINNINVAEKKRPKKDEKVGQPLVSHLSAKVGE